MKKKNPSTKKKSGKPKRKAIMRHSREGVRKGTKGTKGTKGKKGRKANPKAKPRAASRASAKPKAKARTKSSPKRAARRKPASAKAGKAAKRSIATRGRAPRARRTDGAFRDRPWKTRGLGAEAGGQSGDTEGLSRYESADSESVEELLEEGQAFEAGVVSGVEDAPDADKGEVRTRQVNEDDVPEEYIEEK